MKDILTAFLLKFFLASYVFANNLQISNVSLTELDAASRYVMVEFDISWDNSWRTDDLNGDDVENWDAAWLFVKYKKSDGTWHHATLNTTESNHSTGTAGSNVEFHAPDDGKGVFFYRSGNGTGSFSSTGVKLRWEYGTDGISYNINSEISRVEVFGIEMVYVPEGSFNIGSGGDEWGHFYTYGGNNAYEITSEGAITTGTTSGNLWAGGYIGAGTIPADFPKGYAAFYCMKYEITQEQYVKFLNTLTRAQQNTRTGTNLASGVTSVSNRYVMADNSSMQKRNGIRCDESIHASEPITFYCDYNGNGTGNESGDGQNIACNYLSWTDGAAYADWSGLRPMTELEFEKACRGGATPVANEYAWGTTNIAGSAYTLNNAGAGNEEIATNYSTTAGNCSWSTTDGGINGPLRVGIFASNTNNSGRETSGASYYGVMELSGNLSERTVTVGNITGRSFTGTNGNGSIDGSGNADVTNWPGTDAVGSGFRGSDWVTGSDYCRISDRSLALNDVTDRRSNDGFRCVRSERE